MDLTIDLFPSARRYPFQLTARHALVVLAHRVGPPVLAYFLDGELLFLTDKPAGKA